MAAIVTAKNAAPMHLAAQVELRKRAELREKKDLAANKFRVFVEQAWHVVEPSTPFVGGWNLDAVCDHLEGVSAGHIRNLVINVPPRTAKSLLVSVFWPAWDWIKHPELRWLFSAYTSKLSLRDSMKCRRVIESNWYKENWGGIYHLIGDQNTKENYENDKTGQRIATSVSGIGVGAGGDRIVTDDANNTEEIESDLMRQGVLDWWDHTMSTRGNDPKTVARVVIQQRLHEQDLSGHVLDQGGYTHLCLPMRFEINRRCRTVIGGVPWEDPRKENGELLWPERFGDREIRELETRLGSYMSAGQLQQNPAPIGGGILKSQWWKYWQFPGAKLDPVDVPMPDGTFVKVKPVDLPEKFDMVLQSWDCLDSSTEILTEHGWRGRGSISIGDRVYSLNKSNQKLELVPVEKYGERLLRTDERFVRIQSGRIDVRVTEGHDLFVGLVTQKNKVKVVENVTLSAREFTDRMINNRSYKLPVSAEFDFPGVALSDDELRLIAWFITDGGFSNQYIQISQTKYHKHAIRELIRRLGMDFVERQRVPGRTGEFRNAKEGTLFLIPKGTKTGKYLRSGWVHLYPWLDKDISPSLMFMTREQFSVFWSELMKGDGDASNGYLCSCRKVAAERLQQMAVTRGYSSSLHSRPSSSGTTIWYVSARNSQWIKSNPTKVDSSRLHFETPDRQEVVWCVKNSNSTLVTRRNGKVAILGNCAFKDLTTSDFVVGQALAAKGANRFVLDQTRGQMDLPKTLKEVRTFSARHPLAYIKLVEDKANGPAVIQSLHEEIGGFIAVNPIGGKIARAAAASPELEAGNWYLPHPDLADWVQGFISECAGFPKASHDDQVDAWSQGAARLRHVKPAEDEDTVMTRRIQERRQGGWSA